MSVVKALPRIVLIQVILGIACLVLAVFAISATKKTVEEKGRLESQLVETTKTLDLKQREFSELTRRHQEIEKRQAKVRSVVYREFTPTATTDMALKRHRPGAYKILKGIQSVDSLLHLGDVTTDVEALRYNSYGFASFVLDSFSVEDIELIDAHRLAELLPRTSSPVSGDLAFFEDGTALFYFKGEREGDSYFAGMTAFGVAVVKQPLSRITSFAHVRYE